MNQFGRFTMIEPEIGRRLAQPIMDIITRFHDIYHVSNLFLMHLSP